MPKPNKVHQWRLCPLGRHWVITHPRATKTGKIATVHGHCADNPTKKDQLYKDEKDEIDEIAALHFSKLKGAPTPDDLGYTGLGNLYDELIRGWTRYWNDVLSPKDPLDPNVVKALIATESSFDTERDIKVPGRKIKARGLMQVTDETLKILTDEKGELKDHFLTLTRNNLDEPNPNICAGIRWLFRKKELASHRLKREATWKESVAEYKGILEKIVSGKKYNKDIMERFNDKLRRLTK